MNEHKGDFRIVGNELFCILCKRNVNVYRFNDLGMESLSRSVQ